MPQLDLFFVVTVLFILLLILSLFYLGLSLFFLPGLSSISKGLPPTLKNRSVRVRFLYRVDQQKRMFHSDSDSSDSDSSDSDSSDSDSSDSDSSDSDSSDSDSSDFDFSVPNPVPELVFMPFPGPDYVADGLALQQTHPEFYAVLHNKFKGTTFSDSLHSLHKLRNYWYSMERPQAEIGLDVVNMTAEKFRFMDINVIHGKLYTGLRDVLFLDKHGDFVYPLYPGAADYKLEPMIRIGDMLIDVLKLRKNKPKLNMEELFPSMFEIKPIKVPQGSGSWLLNDLVMNHPVISSLSVLCAISIASYVGYNLVGVKMFTVESPITINAPLEMYYSFNFDILYDCFQYMHNHSYYYSCYGLLLSLVYGFYFYFYKFSLKWYRGYNR